MPLAPEITENPGDLTLDAGATGYFEAKATYTQGTGVFTAQWFKDGAAVTAQNNLLGSLNGLEATVRLSFATVTAGSAGSYFCRFASSYGYADAGPATLTVNDTGGGGGGDGGTGDSAIMTPYPVGYLPPVTASNFYAGGQGLSGYFADPPVGARRALGSAALARLTPAPGATLTINEYGLDEISREWVCPSVAAYQIRPDIRDADPYIPGLYCSSSVVVDGEGRMSTVRATYKGLLNNQTRPAERSVSVDTDMQTLTVKTGTTAIIGGGSGIGNNAGVITDNYRTIPDMPVISPIYTLRGAAKDEPSLATLGLHDPNPPRAPAVPETYVYPVYAQQGLGTAMVLVGNMTFEPDPLGWVCEHIEFDEAANYYQVRQQWRLKYVLKSFSLPV